MHDLMAPILAEGVVTLWADGTRRVVWRGVPLGRKLQPPGPKCPEGQHDFERETYEGFRHPYVDKVCRKCPRRVPVK